MVHLAVHLVAAGQNARDGWPQVRPYAWPAEFVHQRAAFSANQQ